MSFSLYTEQNALENIIIDEDQYPIWNKILRENIDILVNTSDKELEAEIIDQESIIFHLLQSSASVKIPVALKSYFETISNDPSETINKPHSAFVLNISKEQAESIKNEYGVAVYSQSDINRDFVTGGFMKELMKNEAVSGGYPALIPQIIPTSNALVITDPYLFANLEGNNNLGTENLINLLDGFLPNTLTADYHIAIITQNTNNRTRPHWNQLTGSIMARIGALREYEIVFELIVTDTIHPRRLLSNHLSGWTDKGFDLFKIRENEKIRQDNSLYLYAIFNNVNDFGDTHMDTLTKELSALKKIIQNTVSYVQRNNQDSFKMILGDCNNDYTLRNRLLN